MTVPDLGSLTPDVTGADMLWYRAVLTLGQPHIYAGVSNVVLLKRGHTGMRQYLVDTPARHHVSREKQFDMPLSVHSFVIIQCFDSGCADHASALHEQQPIPEPFEKSPTFHIEVGSTRACADCDRSACLSITMLPPT